MTCVKTQHLRLFLKIYNILIYKAFFTHRNKKEKLNECKCTSKKVKNYKITHLNKNVTKRSRLGYKKEHMLPKGACRLQKGALQVTKRSVGYKKEQGAPFGNLKVTKRSTECYKKDH